MTTDILKHYLQKAIFELRKHSPEILTGLGIAGVVTGTIMACVATTKLEKTIEPHKKELEDIHSNPNPDEKEHRKEVTKAYAKTAWDITKLYAPSVTVEIAAVACFLGSRKILRNHNAVLAACLSAETNAFDSYKKRMADKYGEDAEKEIRYGINTEEIEEEYTDGKGKKKTRKKTVKTMDENAVRSPYSRFYTVGCDGWSKDPGVSLRNLFEKQAWCNERLKSRALGKNGVGWLFLNEAYELLGYPPIREGAYLGWYFKKGVHEPVIDFGVFDCHDILKCDFVNGFEDTVLLDFNLDGNIVDQFGINNEQAMLDYHGGC